MHGKLKSVRGKKVGHVWTINSSFFSKVLSGKNEKKRLVNIVVL